MPKQSGPEAKSKKSRSLSDVKPSETREDGERDEIESVQKYDPNDKSLLHSTDVLHMFTPQRSTRPDVPEA